MVFDKAYVDFLHLAELEERGVCWVSRAKDNMRFRVRDSYFYRVAGMQS